jgi:cytochrome c peroxidase
VVPGRALDARGGDRLSITRFDALLSGLALRRTNGTWLESRDWYAFLSLAGGRLGAQADGLPPEPFTAIRFRVGLPEAMDRQDPNVWPPDHPLNPSVNGLHWGWQGAYVHLAVEGHDKVSSSEPGGFSYHLAGATTPMWVELPVRFSGSGPTTLRVSFAVDRFLEDGGVIRQAASTHSRAGDALAEQLKRRAPGAVGLKELLADVFQPTTTPGPGSAVIAGTTPFHLDVSQRLPKVRFPEDNPMTVEGVALGERLFREPRLSRNGTQACISCHEPSRGFTDGRPVSTGAEGQKGRRNAMALANLAWGAGFFWDGRAPTLRSQVLKPIQDPQEMNERLDAVVAKLSGDAMYPALFKAAFGSPEITADRIARALEQFLLTLVAQDSKFDRAARGLATLTSREQRGLELFVTEHDPARGLRGADCFHCHGGNLFSNGQFLNNGLKPAGGDLGREEFTGVESDRGKFKVPSLRNVAITGPYMHDGRFETLEQVIEHYNGPMDRTPTLDPNLAKHPREGLMLSPEDKASLAAFLRTLTDSRFQSGPPPGGQTPETPTLSNRAPP